MVMVKRDFLFVQCSDISPLWTAATHIERLKFLCKTVLTNRNAALFCQTARPLPDWPGEVT